MGGEASCPRLLFAAGEYGRYWDSLFSVPAYLLIPDHSLPPTETGDSGPLRPFIVVAFVRNDRRMRGFGERKPRIMDRERSLSTSAVIREYIVRCFFFPVVYGSKSRLTETGRGAGLSKRKGRRQRVRVKEISGEKTVVLSRYYFWPGRGTCSKWLWKVEGYCGGWYYGGKDRNCELGTRWVGKE